MTLWLLRIGCDPTNSDGSNATGEHGIRKNNPRHQVTIVVRKLLW